MRPEKWLPGSLAAGAALVALTGTAGAQVTQLNMGGSSTESGYYPYYTTVAEGISSQYDDLNVTVVSPGGFAENQNLLTRGRLDFGGTSPRLLAEANEQGGDLRVLWWVNPAVQNIMVRKDTGIDNITDLAGECFHPGMQGSSTQRTMMEILQALDIQPELHLSGAEDALNALQNGRCAGQVKSISGNTLDGATAELNVTTPMWPVGYTEEQQETIREAIPWINFFEVDSGIVEGAPAYTTHAIWVGFAAPADLDPNIAYKVVKGMWENIEAQRAVFAPLEGRDVPEQTIEASSEPLHAGAVRYYRELGHEIPDNLIPPEMDE